MDNTVIERPILFSGPMVRAILEGRKTQTRRVVKSKGPLNEFDMAVLREDGKAEFFHAPQSIFCIIKCPHPVGRRLWVRETWTQDERGGQLDNGQPMVYYRADMPDNDVWEGYWKPSIFMPRWACRLKLEVTDVRVERLQEISDKDAMAEGIQQNPVQEGTWIDYPEGSSAAGWKDPRRSFESLWRSINGPDSWQANPWVWVYTFKEVAP